MADEWFRKGPKGQRKHADRRWYSRAIKELPACTRPESKKKEAVC